MATSLFGQNSSGLNSTPGSSEQTTVAPYARPFTNNLLGNTQALANAPMPAYTGQLTSGYGDLQNTAWEGLSGLTLPNSLKTAGTNLQGLSTKAQNLSYDPATSTFDTTAAKNYMNPYIQQSLNPQLAELRRQQQINSLGESQKLSNAGAFGGSRQAIMQGQNNNNLLRQEAGVIGTGYNQAYDKAAAQFNADQARNQAANQFGATYGLQGLQAATQAETAGSTAGTQAAQYGLENLKAMNTAGSQQQAIDQQALNAQYNEYLRQLKYPQDMLTLQRSVLNGLPLTGKDTYSAQQSLAQQVAGGISNVSGIVDSLMGKNFTQTQVEQFLKDTFGSQLTPKQIQAEVDRSTLQKQIDSQYTEPSVQPDAFGNYYAVD